MGKFWDHMTHESYLFPDYDNYSPAGEKCILYLIPVIACYLHPKLC